MKDYWEKYYKENWIEEKSDFANYCSPYINGYFVDLGCGNGRDLYYFLGQSKKGIGVDYAMEGMFIKQQKIEAYIRENSSYNYVYTRFLWHSIDRDLQLKILKWTKKWLFIEARTTQDKKLYKIYKHTRNYVNVQQLLKDLKDNNFEIIRIQEGRGMAVKDREDPHIIRVIAEKRLDK